MKPEPADARGSPTSPTKKEFEEFAKRVLAAPKEKVDALAAKARERNRKRRRHATRHDPTDVV